MKNVFNKLEFNQIRHFFEILQSSKDLNYEYIKYRYNNVATNFKNVFKFFKSLKLIESKDKQLISNIKIKKEIINYDDFLKKYILESIFTKTNPIREYVLEYLNNFKLENDIYKYKPKTSDRLRNSNLRNLLIELDLIGYNSLENSYFILEKYLILFLKIKEKNKISQKNLDYIINRKYKLGLLAEYRIIEYEKNRLAYAKQLLNEIQHVALTNVNAGYDILSWDYLKNSSFSLPRYIEVKAVTDTNYSFYWTNNEYEVAKKEKDRYFLYLLPVINNNFFNINDLKIIQNPIFLISNKNKNWNKKVEKYHIWKKI